MAGEIGEPMVGLAQHPPEPGRLAGGTSPRPEFQQPPEQLTRKAAGLLALDLVEATDDDKEHFWVLLLNVQNHYLMHTEVSVGTQSATLVHPGEVWISLAQRGEI